VYRDPSGLTAYVVRVTSAGASDASVRQLCAERLPDYMVPTSVVTVEALPLNANGKLDRKAVAALPAADEDASGAKAYEAPRDPIEAAIAQVWAEVLKKEQVGIHDNFFDLGGHSLMAIRILGRLSRAFQIRVPLRALFEAPTVAQLGQTIAAARNAAANGAAPAGASV
jgi:acyl carrier protein